MRKGIQMRSEAEIRTMFNRFDNAVSAEAHDADTEGAWEALRWVLFPATADDEDLTDCLPKGY
jgi:hypothetical protein